MDSTSGNHSHLFMVRLWPESGDRQCHAVRIQVHHVLSGDVRYFRAWFQAIEFIAEYVNQQECQFAERQQAEHEENTV